jgi:hypothetical protein
LLEIVLAMGILVVVSSMTYWFYSSALATGESGTDMAYRFRLSRVVLDRIATEIRQAAAITADNRVGIRGEPERIWLSPYRVPSREQSRERSLRDEPRPPEYDLTKVEYKIARHPEILDEDGHEFALGLARIEVSVPRPLPVLAVKELGDGEGTDDAEGEEIGVEDEQFEGDPFEDELFEDESFEDELFEDEFAGDDEDEGDASLTPDINWEELYAPEIRYLRFCGGTVGRSLEKARFLNSYK